MIEKCDFGTFEEGVAVKVCHNLLIFVLSFDSRLCDLRIDVCVHIRGWGLFGLGPMCGRVAGREIFRGGFFFISTSEFLEFFVDEGSS
jgi:hypothetical protein